MVVWGLLHHPYEAWEGTDWLGVTQAENPEARRGSLVEVVEYARRATVARIWLADVGRGGRTRSPVRLALAVAAVLVLLVTAFVYRTVLADSGQDIVQLAPREGVRFEPTSRIRVNPAAEAELTSLLNQQRIRAGLHRVILDPRLTAVARSHSRDMYESGYFGHVSPQGLDSFDRLSVARIRYVVAGENLAIGPSARQVQEQMLSSPSHHANIMRPEYCRAGVGVYEGPYGLIVTEVFIAWHPYGVPPSEWQCS